MSFLRLPFSKRCTELLCFFFNFLVDCFIICFYLHGRIRSKSLIREETNGGRKEINERSETGEEELGKIKSS